jgi:hypothetical protein
MKNEWNNKNCAEGKAVASPRAQVAALCNAAPKPGRKPFVSGIFSTRLKKGQQRCQSVGGRNRDLLSIPEGREKKGKETTLERRIPNKRLTSAGGSGYGCNRSREGLGGVSGVSESLPLKEGARASKPAHRP